MKKFNLLTVTLLSVNLVLAAFAVVAIASTKTEELNNKLQSKSRMARVEAAKTISSSAIQDPTIYATIDMVLKENFDNPSQEKQHIDEMAWMCKALASSGDSRYEETLRLVIANTSNRKLQNYANQSIELIPYYAERSRQMNQAGDFSDAFSNVEKQYANMVKSDILKLRKDGAKKIVRSGSVNQELYAIVNDTLLKTFDPKETGREEVDTLAWLCKALAASGNIEFIPTLEKIVNTTESIKLKKYSSSSLKSLRSANE